jgi:glycolate oxidase FAD binding subunit
MSTAHNTHIDLFREQILAAAKNKIPLSIEGGGTKTWYGNANSYDKLDTRPYSGILEYQPEELVITACAGTPLKEISGWPKNQVLARATPFWRYFHLGHCRRLSRAWTN